MGMSDFERRRCGFNICVVPSLFRSRDLLILEARYGGAADSDGTSVVGVGCEGGCGCWWR